MLQKLQRKKLKSLKTASSPNFSRSLTGKNIKSITSSTARRGAALA
ncbi:hypothetical protein [Paenibacillus terricola]|nr:hypothetical protein [Paenibacillus terricola]